jgi:hypothetical protein
MGEMQLLHQMRQMTLPDGEQSDEKADPNCALKVNAPTQQSGTDSTDGAAPNVLDGILSSHHPSLIPSGHFLIKGSEHTHDDAPALSKEGAGAPRVLMPARA